MKTDKHIVEVLVRAFFNSYFTKMGSGILTTDITSAQPITIKQLLVNNIDSLSGEFNKAIARAFASVNGIEIPQRLSEPKTFEGATSLIKYTLGGDKKLYEHMVERYKYHFNLALTGTVERTDSVNDTDVWKAIILMK